MDTAAKGVEKQALLRDFPAPSPHPTRIFLLRYALTLLPLAVAAALAAQASSLPAFVLVALVAGFTQNALGILMHEGCHNFFHRDRRVNDALADLLVCLPILNTVQGYRLPHFKHHLRTGTSEDPYYALYMTYRRRADIAAGLLRDLAGVTAVAAFLQRYVSGDDSVKDAWPFWRIAALAAIHGGLFAGAWWLTGSVLGYLWLWLLPLATIPIAINRIRTVVEHFPGAGGVPANRTTRVGLVEYACIAPYGYSHHFEHHLAPQIPYYQLRLAHEQLHAQGMQHAAHEIAPRGYLRAFARLLGEIPSV